MSAPTGCPVVGAAAAAAAPLSHWTAELAVLEVQWENGKTLSYIKIIESN